MFVNQLETKKIGISSHIALPEKRGCYLVMVIRGANHQCVLIGILIEIVKLVGWITKYFPMIELGADNEIRIRIQERNLYFPVNASTPSVFIEFFESV